MMSLAKLSKIAVFCAVTSVGMGYGFHRAFVRKMSENPLYLEAVEEVKKHPGVISLLGEPLLFKNPVLANKGMLLSGYSDVQVRVRGPISDGIVFLKVIRADENNIKVDAIHVQIGKDQSKRLVVKASENEKPQS